MPRPTKPFGTLLREFRQQIGLSQDALAAYLNRTEQQRKLSDYMKVDGSRIERIETGIAPPPRYPVFYEHLAAVPGILESDITRLRETAQYELAWWVQERNLWDIFTSEQIPEKLPEVPEIVQEYRKLPYWKYHRALTSTIRDFIRDARTLVAEEAEEYLTKSLQSDDRIPILDPEKGEDSAPDWMRLEGDQLSHGKEAERQPSSQPEQGEQVPRKGTVFERSDARLFFEALENPDHRYNLQAEAALQGFTKAVEKARVTSLNKVSSAYGIPIKNLSEWVAKGLIPYVSRDKNAIYLSKEIAEEVARDAQEAKEMGVQTARLLRERREKYFPSIPNR